MEMRRYGVCMTCPKCGSKTTLKDAAYRADGEQMFVFYCPKCEELVRFIIFSSELQRVAMIKDMENDKPLPISSPLSTPQWIKQEKEWEREIGISWQQKGG